MPSLCGDATVLHNRTEYYFWCNTVKLASKYIPLSYLPTTSSWLTISTFIAPKPKVDIDCKATSGYIKSGYPPVASKVPWGFVDVQRNFAPNCGSLSHLCSHGSQPEPLFWRSSTNSLSHIQQPKLLCVVAGWQIEVAFVGCNWHYCSLLTSIGTCMKLWTLKN